MPAYALDAKALCFVQPASKSDTRYTTLGFNDSAQVGDGAMWPASFAVTKVGEAGQQANAELVQRTALPRARATCRCRQRPPAPQRARCPRAGCGQTRPSGAR